MSKTRLNMGKILFERADMPCVIDVVTGVTVQCRITRAHNVRDEDATFEFTGVVEAIIVDMDVVARDAWEGDAQAFVDKLRKIVPTSVHLDFVSNDPAADDFWIALRNEAYGR